jgi:hypothetical protein
MQTVLDPLNILHLLEANHRSSITRASKVNYNVGTTI